MRVAAMSRLPGTFSRCRRNRVGSALKRAGKERTIVSQQNVYVQGSRGASYHATLIRDAGEAAAVKIEHLTLAPGDSLSVDLRSGGGFVAKLRR
jgi:hypothetical protein